MDFLPSVHTYEGMGVTSLEKSVSCGVTLLVIFHTKYRYMCKHLNSYRNNIYLLRGKYMPKINRVFTAEPDVSNWIDTKKRTSEGFVLSHLINRLLRALRNIRRMISGSLERKLRLYFLLCYTAREQIPLQQT